MLTSKNFIAFVVLTLCLLAGCAAQQSRPAGTTVNDPWEDFNRKVFSFNDFLDRNILKPTAEFYVEYTPKWFRTGVNNFFTNLFSIFTIVNEIFQLKITEAISDTLRLLVNTTVGLLGFIDVASMIGLEKHKEDFGQTLGYWGVDSGPYLVLPLLGPRTLRDATSDVVDFQYYDPYRPFPGDSDWAARGFNLVDTRARLLALEEGLIEGDRYSLIRDAYLQRRRFDIADGEIEEDPFADDDFDAEWEEDEEYLELDFDN